MVDTKSSKSLSLDEYQSAAAKTAIYPQSPHVLRFDGAIIPLYPFLKLGGECGETQEKVGKIIRDNQGIISPPHMNSLAMELGDILWYVADCARILGYTLEEIARLNMSKLASRAQRDKLQGSGDLR